MTAGPACWKLWVADFLTEIKGVIQHVWGKLDLVQTIDATVLFETIKEVRFTVLSDVTNPLLKKRRFFCLCQTKGAKEELPILDAKMANYARVLESYLKKDFSVFPVPERREELVLLSQFA